MDASLKFPASVELCQSQYILHDSRQICFFSHVKRFRLTSLLQEKRKQSSSLQIFADISRRFYSIRRNPTSRRILDTRLQSSGRSTEPTVVKTVPVQVAHELLNAGHRYLDVRTPEEFVAGHINGAINIPYMYKKGAGMAKNLNFIQDVLLQFGKDDEIVVGCQSGKRSEMAAAELVAVGFTGVTDVAGGYSAWVQSGLASRSSA